MPIKYSLNCWLCCPICHTIAFFLPSSMSDVQHWMSPNIGLSLQDVASSSVNWHPSILRPASSSAAALTVELIKMTKKSIWTTTVANRWNGLECCGRSLASGHQFDQQQSKPCDHLLLKQLHDICPCFPSPMWIRSFSFLDRKPWRATVLATWGWLDGAGKPLQESWSCWQ